jgi:peptidoglycan hydrolase CwlO-like protein
MVKHKKLLEEKLKQQDTSLNNFMKDRGSSDLELQIKLLQKEIDTLKTIIDIKDIEIDSLKEDIENKKWQDEIANNTPNSSQFDKV